MINSNTLKFLKDLNAHNNKAWFDEHRHQFEIVKSDFYLFVESLIAAVAKFDAPIGQLSVKACVFRINRDVRFSKNKTPYKTNLSCYLNNAGKKGLGAGYYLHIEPGKSMAAGGIWMPETGVLSGIRQEIDYNFTDWKKIIEHKHFRKTFTEGVKTNDRLVRPPKGYDEDNEAIAFLKMKSFIVSKPFTDSELQNNNFVKEVAKTFNCMKPMIDFLNTAVH